MLKQCSMLLASYMLKDTDPYSRNSKQSYRVIRKKINLIFYPKYMVKMPQSTIMQAPYCNSGTGMFCYAFHFFFFLLNPILNPNIEPNIQPQYSTPIFNPILNPNIKPNIEHYYLIQYSTN